MILNVNTISQLNRALENSFGNIKRDINEIKVLVHSSADRYGQLQREILTIKDETASKDKINVLKIKLGEVNEELKKVWEIEKKVNVMNQPPKKAFQESLDELNAKLVSTELRLNNEMKTSASENQLKTVVAGINKELNALAQEIRKVEFKKDILSNDVVRSFENKIGNKFRENNQAFIELRKDLKNYVDKNELRGVVNEMTNDFDSVRKELLSVQKDAKSFVRDSEIKNVIAKINNEFDVVSKDLNSLKTQSKDFVTVKQIKGLIDDISDEFDDIKKELSNVRNTKLSGKNFESQKKFLESQKARKDAEIKSSTYGASMIVREPAKKVAVKSKQKSGSYAKTYAFANFLIVAAFLSLFLSIGSYFFLTEAWMNNSAIAAVCTFVIGMILRSIAIVKRK
ncbi:hypothetical protein JXB27_02635 [Candidatus Woesearchaeota archaeon]|nr:hypothetical protein [Candidatus Woesearchaeota archaeon]